MALDIFYTQLKATQRDIHWYVNRYGSIRGKYRMIRHPWKWMTMRVVCPLEGTGVLDTSLDNPEAAFLRLQDANIKRIEAEAIIWAADGRRGHDPTIRANLMWHTGIEIGLLTQEGIAV